MAMLRRFVFLEIHLPQPSVIMLEPFYIKMKLSHGILFSLVRIARYSI